ncbi:MAG: antibiotic biosynthesis monooxygenase [Pseudomonadota bacterium]
MAIVSFLSRMTIHADKKEQFVQCCTELTEKVLAHEPECLYFRFYKLRDEPLGYAVFESFLNDDAEEAHMKTDYFERIVPGLVECLDGPYVREYLDPLDS